MSSSSKPVKQDYITKVRYTNNLPPPPLNPKFIEYNTTNPKSKKQEGDLISSLFRKENFRHLMEKIDESSGLELNLLNNYQFFYEPNSQAIGQLHKYDNPNDIVELHEKDKALLRDAGVGKINKAEPGVAFLRRTEYISEKPTTSSQSLHDEELKVNEKLSKSNENKLDPDSQLEAVENTFTIAEDIYKDLSKVKHPKRKHLKAVNAWPLLPDTSMLDSSFMTLKFMGSASLQNQNKKTIDSSIFRPIKSEDGEWVSMFQLNNESRSNQLLQKLNSTEREKPINLLDEEEEENLNNYQFEYQKNYDMQYFENQDLYDELAIKFVPDETNPKKRKIAYYYPIAGRVELKRHRASKNSEINKFIKERTFDGINLKIREPTTNELKKLDKIRSAYDPMEYEGEEEDIDQQHDAQVEEQHRQEDLQDLELHEEQAEEDENVENNIDEIDGDVNEEKNIDEDVYERNIEERQVSI
ncbi:unnamed protein product [Candida verbasci]|uniref:RNA polymerase II-associated protein 1 n=1 Tax=Candida verbasci TaxID=1227364 RepID=A0A9W4TWB6_9ASCO|nr:unnamed protein product [Candida verbasci]